MDIADIADAARRGERWAGPALVTVVCPVLAGYAATIAPDLSEADREYAIEMAVTRAVSRIDRYDPERAGFTAWLRPFVAYALADRRRTRPSSLPISHDPVHVDLNLPDQATTTERLDIAELAAQVQCLSPTDQLILELRHGERLNYAQIAERIGGGVTEGACRVRHHRALQRLRLLLQTHPAFAHYFEETA